MSVHNTQPVLILGAGINGAAVARELLLNGVPVCVVDVRDIACGATSRSSRLIHGGLRYLEHGDFALVRESLAERRRLQQLAPQFVSPLRLHIPVTRRTGGWLQSLRRFLGIDRWPGLRRLLRPATKPAPRGLWLVRSALWLYDLFAGDDQFERSQAVATTDSGAPQVDAEKYPWQCRYADGQMLYPERFVVALFEDARQLAAEQKVDFQLLTYHRAELQGDKVRIHSLLKSETPALSIRPQLIINATGAWGDWTLAELKQPSRQLFGGTKGSHFVTFHAQLKQAIGGGGVYAEADDGRLVFVLPFGAGVLIGTTDERFSERPNHAVATHDELEYLIELVNDLFPQVKLTADDIELHYAGVRPLPFQPIGRAGAIPRGHSFEWSNEGELPILTLIGGKLTTCRALAEEVVAALADPLNLADITNSRGRVVPGGEQYPTDSSQLLQTQQQLAQQSRFDLETIRSVWSLCGTGTIEAVSDISDAESELLVGTRLPLAYVHRVIRQEWVTTLDDLVERRLMLLFQPDLSRETLTALADCLAANGKLELAEIDVCVETLVDRLRDVYGKQIRRTMSGETIGDGDQNRLTAGTIESLSGPLSTQLPEGT